jgi:hypothetical protein
MPAKIKPIAKKIAVKKPSNAAVLKRATVLPEISFNFRKFLKFTLES